jgi:hypothetical protein
MQEGAAGAIMLQINNILGLHVRLHIRALGSEH